MVGEAEAEHEGAGDGVAAGARRGVPEREPEEERDGEVVQREDLRGDGVAPDAGREREEPPGDDAPGGRAGGARTARVSTPAASASQVAERRFSRKARLPAGRWTKSAPRRE